MYWLYRNVTHIFIFQTHEHPDFDIFYLVSFFYTYTNSNGAFFLESWIWMYRINMLLAYSLVFSILLTFLWRDIQQACPRQRDTWIVLIITFRSNKSLFDHVNTWLWAKISILWPVRFMQERIKSKIWQIWFGKNLKLNIIFFISILFIIYYMDIRVQWLKFYF